MSATRFARLTVKRGLHLLFVLWGISVITFGMVCLAPGDPAEVMLAARNDAPSPEKVAALRQELGLDDPLWLRYIRWLGHAVVLDLGRSYKTGEPVSREILSRLPATLELALSTFAFVVIFSTLSGVVSALCRDRMPDRLGRAGAILSISLPDYWLGLLLIFFLSLRLGLFPVMGREGAASFVLPVLTLGLSIAAVQGRVLRAGIIEIMSRDHVRFAHAKGLSQRSVFRRHVLRNALPPILTLWGMCLGHLLGGAVVVETVFSWPGLGKLSVEAVLNRDFPLIQGAVLFMALCYVVASQVTDLICRLLDPRISEGRA
ncbi:nickel ABC transporter permease subunit NikB [Desulfonema ishimotonii]|uniref:Nickel ABC transporter permease subunit NikB n=1 Tax=Desulfonema ishimotonii TaxID=45657 RepID=A0A401FX89_9BACT|nr:nickel ABC transporter permease subunit NikB [Desulfonema ishimotonii]